MNDLIEECKEELTPPLPLHTIAEFNCSIVAHRVAVSMPRVEVLRMVDLSNSVLGLCPNCAHRRADTVVDYYEIVAFTYSARRSSRMRRQINWRKTWVSGKAQLCDQCANLYNKSVSRRQMGRRLVNWGAAILFGGALLFLILYANVSALKSGIGAFIIALPTLLGLICLLYGVMVTVLGTTLKRRATHFLDKRLRSS